MPHILGIQRLDYISKKTNQPVKGYSFHVADKNKKVIGQECYSFFANDDVSSSLIGNGSKPELEALIGQEISVSYNRYNSPDELTLV